MSFSLRTLLSLSILFSFSSAMGAIPNKSEDAKLLEELTGKKAELPAKKVAAIANKQSTQVPQKVAQNTSMSKKLLDSGFYEFTKKNYISALKHYNTIIVKYPQSKEYRLAYLAKAKLYHEMGLVEQAQLNLKTAQDILNKTQNTK